MLLVESVADLRLQVAAWRRAGRRVAFVPTMGSLHAGHLRLVQVAREHADAVVASIYVNPLQFGPNEDFASYPRTLDADRAALERERTDLLFLPPDREMYPRGLGVMTRVEVPGVSEILCGAFRPGHFRGVATAVNRLFNLVAPDVAVFGKKDYQQLLIVRLMVADLAMPLEVVGVDTVREEDGLAMSSRNHYLSAAERKTAARLHAALNTARARLVAGEGIAGTEKAAAAELAAAGFRPDYVSVRRRVDLGVPAPGERELVILAAAWLGRTRLIDNVELELKVI
jgi:pantoate--beta-alanine ligase